MSYQSTFPALSLSPPQASPAPPPSGERASTGHVCPRCRRVHPRGQFVSWCPGPQLRHGLRSRLLQAGALPSQAEAVAALAARQAEIEADLGGADALSRVHRDAIRDLLRLELVGDFLFERLTSEGPLTGKGRTRAALNAYLLVVDRITRLRHMVGLERRQKPVPTLREYLDTRPSPPASTSPSRQPVAREAGPPHEGDAA